MNLKQRKSHLKKCARQQEVSPQQLIALVRVQEEEAAQRQGGDAADAVLGGALGGTTGGAIGGVGGGTTGAIDSTIGGVIGGTVRDAVRGRIR